MCAQRKIPSHAGAINPSAQNKSVKLNAAQFRGSAPSHGLSIDARRHNELVSEEPLPRLRQLVGYPLRDAYRK